MLLLSCGMDFSRKERKSYIIPEQAWTQGGRLHIGVMTLPDAETTSATFTRHNLFYGDERTLTFDDILLHILRTISCAKASERKKRKISYWRHSPNDPISKIKTTKYWSIHMKVKIKREKSSNTAHFLPCVSHTAQRRLENWFSNT
jgi:hypothetical protein